MGKSSYRALIPALFMMLLMFLTPLQSILTIQDNAYEFEDNKSSKTLHMDVDFNESDGFTPSNISIEQNTGEAVLDHPVISWQGISNSGLLFARTGACAVHVPSTNQVLLMGGRADPSPSQTGDEVPTNIVETYDILNKTWAPSDESMQLTQMYFGCSSIGEKVYTIGDYHPYNTPEIRSEGIVQILNTSNDTWIEGSSMPSGKAVGLAGVDNVGDFIYVAGGVSRKDRSDVTDRLMRYNTNTDTWDEMATMNLARHSFSLVEYHGKLYALGGYQTTFDPTLNQNVSSPTNHTEVYDVLTDTWTNHSVLPFEIAAYASTIHNDEIIISGGITGTGFNVQSSDVYGYNPLTGAMNTHTQLSVDMYDHTITATNGSIIYASGDSSYYRFSSWGTNYLDRTEYFENPTSHAGWLTSDVIDLRKTVLGTSSLAWLEFSGQTPTDTELKLQYKIGQDASTLGVSNWLPMGLQNSTQFFNPGNHSLMTVGQENSFFQYRIQFNTSELNNWKIPSLDYVKVYSEESTLMAQPPASFHPNAAPIDITSFHSSYATDSSYSLLLHSTNSDGFDLPNSNTVEITWDPETDSFAINDSDGILKQSEISVSLTSSSDDGDEITWSLAVEEGLPSDYLALEVQTHGLHETKYRSPEIINIENILDVHVLDYSSNFSSQGGLEVNTGEVFPDGAVVDVTVDHSFNSTGARLLYGVIEARLHIDVESPNNVWFNSTGEWFTLQTGYETTTSIILPNSSSGDAEIWIEARTQDDFELNVNPSSKAFVLNVDAPVQISTTPLSGTYLNEMPKRNVEFEFYDVGGFSNDTVQAKVWIQALHDTNSDDQFSSDEAIPAELNFAHSGHLWILNLTVNDTANSDHEMVHVVLEGTNFAGKNIRDITHSPDNGQIAWMSRTPEKASVSLLEPLFDTTPEGELRLEPTGHIGWKVIVSDSNNMSDIAQVRIELGNDESLGMRYNTNLGTCEEMDARIQVDSSCYATLENDSLVIYFIGKVSWTFVNSALDLGYLEVQVDDYDGTNEVGFENQWVLQRQMSIEMEPLVDVEGPIQGELRTGWSMISGEHVQLNASIHHLVSNASYNGYVSVFWRGKIQNDFFSSSFSAEVIDGKLSTQIQTPMGSGLWHQTVLEIWDPYDSEKLFTTELPNMILDGDAPVLLPSTLTTGVSRYHLDSVEIGVSIAETNSWSGNLTLSCQIQALDFEWPVITLSRESTTVFNGKTMFSFVYNFAEQGDPSTLSTQSNIACWASGSDDAGWILSAPEGNSQNNPWLISSLSNVGPDLAIDSVEFEGDSKPGSTLRMEMRILSTGEQIEVPFNISISVVQGEVSTIVARESLTGIAENSAVNIRSTLVVPDGEWTLKIEIDQEQEIWELSEINNIWTQNYTSQDDGFSGVFIAASAGGGILVIIGLSVVVLRMRKVDEEEVGKPTESKPLSGPPQKSSKATKAPSNLKGPPPKTAESTVEVEAEPVSETSHLPDIGTSVSDYSQLPGGGDYQYDGGQTTYTGLLCGTWKQNPDESFTRTH